MRAAVLTLAILLTASGCPQEPTKPTPSKVCHEEDPCWNCHIHGNKRCGPGETRAA